MQDNTIYLLYNTNAEKVQLVHNSETFVSDESCNQVNFVNRDKFTIIYSPDDERQFTDIKVCSKTKLKDILISSESFQTYTKRKCVDGIIIRRATSVSSMEDLFVIRNCTLIQPLLSETEILRLNKYQDSCKAKNCEKNKTVKDNSQSKLKQYYNSQLCYVRDSLKSNGSDFSSSSTLRRNEDAAMIHSQAMLTEGQVLKGSKHIPKLLKDQAIQPYNKIAMNKIMTTGSKSSIKNHRFAKNQNEKYDLKEKKFIVGLGLPKNDSNLKSLVMSAKTRNKNIGSKTNEKKISLVNELDNYSPYSVKKGNMPQLLRKSRIKEQSTELKKTTNKFEKKMSDIQLLQLPVKLTKNEKNKRTKTFKSENKLSLKMSLPHIMLENNELEKTLLEPAVKSLKKEANRAHRSKGGIKVPDTNIKPEKEREIKLSEGNSISQKIWENKVQQSNKLVKPNSSLAVIASNKSDKSENKLSESKRKTRKGEQNKREDISQLGKSDDIHATSPGKEHSSSDARSVKLKLESEQNIGEQSIQRIGRPTDKESTKISDKTVSTKLFKHSSVSNKKMKTDSNVLFKHNLNNKEKNYDNRHYVNWSKDVKSLEEESKQPLASPLTSPKQPLTSPLTSPKQGQDEDVIKSTKVNVTKQSSVSNKESTVNHSNVSFETSTNKGSKHQQSRVLTFINGNVIQYALSNPVFINIGWTQQTVDRTISRVVTFSAVPANPQTFCFRIRSEVERKFYPNGNLALCMREDGIGEIYYPSGNLAIVAQMSSTGMRLILFSDLEDTVVDKVPRVIGVFDSFGNGVLYSMKGEKILVFNQLQGIFYNPNKNICYKWRWSTYKVLENQRLNVLLLSMVKEIKEVASVTKPEKPGGKNFIPKRDVEKVVEDIPDNDQGYESGLVEMPSLIRDTPKIKKYNNSIFKPIIFKLNKEITLRINGQDKVLIQFWRDKVFYSLDLGVVVDPHRVERIDEVDPDKLSEVPCVFDDLLFLSPSLERLESSVRH